MRYIGAHTMSEFRGETVQFLADSRIPLRLATTTPSGWPIVVSLWFIHLAGSLWCATQDSAVIVGHLRNDPRCGFEVAPDRPPYRGVRGRAKATLHAARGEEILRTMLDRYLGGTESALARQLLSKSQSEVAIEITPVSIHSWDYRKRMTGSVEE